MVSTWYPAFRFFRKSDLITVKQRLTTKTRHDLLESYNNRKKSCQTEVPYEHQGPMYCFFEDIRVLDVSSFWFEK